MQEVGLNQLLEAGVHFGHQTRRWNPKMRKYIFTERNGIHIIDLRKTLDRLQAAQRAIHDVVTEGEKVLFVCTKDQLKENIREEAERCGAFYVTERWLGGMLTNFQTIRKQIRRLKEIERGQEENAFDYYTKKERLLLDRERQKLERYLSGVKDMSRLPGALFVVDAKREIIAVREANRLDIPVIAITDTNADPDRIDFPIPGNDDAIRSVSLIAKAIADSVQSAKMEVPEDERKLAAEMEATTYSTETGETVAEDAVEEKSASKKKKKKRAKRVPQPEKIAKVRKGRDADEDDDLEDLEDLDEEDLEDLEDEEPEAEAAEAVEDEVEETGEAEEEQDEEAEASAEEEEDEEEADEPAAEAETAEEAEEAEEEEEEKED